MIVYVLFVHEKSVSKRKGCIIFMKNKKLKKTPKNPFLVGFFYMFFWVGFLLPTLPGRQWPLSSRPRCDGRPAGEGVCPRSAQRMWCWSRQSPRAPHIRGSRSAPGCGSRLGIWAGGDMHCPAAGTAEYKEKINLLLRCVGVKLLVKDKKILKIKNCFSLPRYSNVQKMFLLNA